MLRVTKYKGLLLRYVRPPALAEVVEIAGDDTSTTGAGVDAGLEFSFTYDNEAFSDRVLRIEVGGGSHKRRHEDEDEDDEGDDEACIDSSCTVMGTPVLRVNTVHVSSEILAAHSPFFLKLFSNGMKESDQRDATLQIADSEEKAFMELLRFMYSRKLTSEIEPSLLVAILVAADKFEVASCMKYCSQQLIDLPMTPESAVRCLYLPRSISMASDIKEAAKNFLAERYKEFLSTKFQDELMMIPLSGIRAILSRNRIGVESEGSVYDFLLTWACLQYPNPEQRHKILSSRLLPLVPRALSMTDAVLIDHPSCIIYFTIKREKCLELFTSGFIRSQPFHCAVRGFLFLADCKIVEQEHFFGVSIKMLEEDQGAVSGTIEYIIGFKTTPSLRFSTKHCHPTTSHFIDDKVHVRVQVKITPQP